MAHAEAAEEPDPQVQQLLEMLESMNVPEFDDLTPQEARQVYETFSAGGEPSVELEAVSDDTIDGPGGPLPVRIYDPGAGPTDPVIVYLHGGGFVIGSIETHDAGCRRLAEETGSPVVSVDYRLAPEHPFPAALEDTYAALEWASGSEALPGDTDRVVLAGDSAGGNLATAACLLSRYRDGPKPAYQVLVYPVTGDASETPSYEENAEGYFLTSDIMEWFREHLFERDVDEGNVFAAPRLAHDLSGLPPATVVTAGYDPLRDDGARYAERLEADGVEVSFRNYPAMVHGFAGMIEEPVALETGKQLYVDIAEDLAAALE